MLEKGKISAFQMAFMILPTITATAVLIVPSISSKYAERDMWISPIFASLNGFFTVFIVYQLHKRYPKESIIQYSKYIIGKVPAKIVGFIYLFSVLHICSLATRECADFIIDCILPKTPITVIVGSLILVCSFAVRGGVEVLGRSAQVLAPLFLLPPLLLLLLIPDLKIANIFPIMEHGIMPPVLGAAVPQAWFSEVSLITMLLPFVTDSEKGQKWGMITVAVVMFVLLYLNIIGILLFGGTMITYMYPVITAFRYVSFATFFEHLESIVISFWVLGAFIKIAVFYYVLVLGTSQWLNLSNYRPIVFPFGFLVLLFSLWVSSNGQEMAEFLETISPFYIPSIMTFIPLVLLLIIIIRKKNSYNIKE